MLTNSDWEQIGNISKIGKAKCLKTNYLAFLFVPRPGLEPGWVAPLVFETSASTDSAIWALALFAVAKLQLLFVVTKFCGI